MRPSNESFLEGAGKMALWVQELKRIYRSNVDDDKYKHEDDYIDKEILYSDVPPEQPGSGSIRD